MIPSHSFVVDDSVVKLFSESNQRDRDELLRIFNVLAKSPNQKYDWLQRTKSGRELRVKRFGKWLISFWPDDPVLEVRIADVKKILP